MRLRQLLYRDKIEPKLVDALDESVQLGLVDHLAPQNGFSIRSLHLHPVEEVGEALVQFASDGEPVRGALHRTGFHVAGLRVAHE